MTSGVKKPLETLAVQEMPNKVPLKFGTKSLMLNCKVYLKSCTIRSLIKTHLKANSRSAIQAKDEAQGHDGRELVTPCQSKPDQTKSRTSLAEGVEHFSTGGLGDLVIVDQVVGEDAKQDGGWNVNQVRQGSDESILRERGPST